MLCSRSPLSIVRFLQSIDLQSKQYQSIEEISVNRIFLIVDIQSINNIINFGQLQL
jgi:hypothetical protein